MVSRIVLRDKVVRVSIACAIPPDYRPMMMNSG